MIKSCKYIIYNLGFMVVDLDNDYIRLRLYSFGLEIFTSKDFTSISKHNLKLFILEQEIIGILGISRLNPVSLAPLQWHRVNSAYKLEVVITDFVYIRRAFPADNSELDYTRATK